MQFPAQVQAAIELLDEIHGKDVPADVLSNQFFRSRRYVGSKDRRVISEIVFACIRQHVQLSWWVSFCDLSPDSRSYVLLYLLLVEGLSSDEIRQTFAGQTYQPKSLSPAEGDRVAKYSDHDLIHQDMTEAEKLGLEQWSYEALTEVFGDSLAQEVAALGDNAPLDVRVNTLKASTQDVKAAMKKLGWQVEATPFSQNGLRLKRGTPLSSSDLYRSGSVDVQDEASQVAAALCDVQPGHAVLDFCAGAGGKTLALAADMQNKGRLIATDILEVRLKNAKDRLRRAGVSNHQVRVLDIEGNRWLQRQEKRFDRVLVDAPCSGSGTWRRNPDLKLRYVLEDLDELVKKQAEILQRASVMVKPGGRLIYATCSLYRQENEIQVEAFIKNNEGFRMYPCQELWRNRLKGTYPGSSEMLRLSPYKNSTDGFFVAVLSRAIN